MGRRTESRYKAGLLWALFAVWKPRRALMLMDLTVSMPRTVRKRARPAGTHRHCSFLSCDVQPTSARRRGWRGGPFPSAEVWPGPEPGPASDPEPVPDVPFFPRNHRWSVCKRCSWRTGGSRNRFTPFETKPLGRKGSEGRGARGGKRGGGGRGAKGVADGGEELGLISSHVQRNKCF